MNSKNKQAAFADPALALTEAIRAADYIDARLIMDIAPMTRLFEIIPKEEIVRFETRQITPEQWQITLLPQ